MAVQSMSSSDSVTIAVMARWMLGLLRMSCRVFHGREETSTADSRLLLRPTRRAGEEGRDGRGEGAGADADVDDARVLLSSVSVCLSRLSLSLDRSSSVTCCSSLSRFSLLLTREVAAALRFCS